MSDIKITGWGKEHGPAYTVFGKTLDKRRHKQVVSEHVVREQNGRNYSKPAYAVVEHKKDSWLVANKGYSYSVNVRTLGAELKGNLHCDDDYGVILLEGDDATVISVEPLVSEDDSES